MHDFRPNRASRLRRLAAHARTLAAFYFIVLFIGTHLPIPPDALDVIDNKDKLLHFGGYAVLTVVVLAGWELTVGRLQPKHYFAVWLAGTVYGAIDELTQTYVGRSSDVNDWGADVLGIVAGLLVFRIASGLMWRAILMEETPSAA
ncbi:MAG: hypothetical protein DCC67_19415 [Planctomycetota bacterium]|nr:MAG: hypothetical protein DCC67_19415 [Planctomycetota bacterium]